SRFFCIRFRCCALARAANSRTTLSTSIRLYQTSRFRKGGNSRIARGYERAPPVLIFARVLVSKPRSRPATAKLATRRLTSHSNGPGRVSSKSLGAKPRRRGGGGKMPEVEKA